MTDRLQPVRRGANDEETRVGWRMGALGMQTAAEVAAGALLGWLADRWFGTTQGVAIGAVAGILVGLWSLIKGAMKLMKDLDRKQPPRAVPPLPIEDWEPDDDEHQDEWDDDKHDDDTPPARR